MKPATTYPETIAELKAEMHIPAVTVTPQGLISGVNQPFETLFGWEREDVVGQTLSVIIPPALRDAHHLGFSRFLVSESSTLLNQPVPVPAIARDGSERPVELRILAEKHNGEWLLGATLTPLT